MENLVSHQRHAAGAARHASHHRSSLTINLSKALGKQPALKHRRAHRTCGTTRNSSDVQTISVESVEESIISASWDEINGRSLVAIVPIAETRIVDSAIAQPLVLPEELDHLRETAEREKRPGLLRRFWRAYIKALDENPILIKSATSFFGFLIGDLLAQGLGGRSFDLYRCLRLLAFGITMDGPVGHVWYMFLDGNIFPEEPRSNKAVVLKMLADQLLWAPFFSCVFFTFTNTLAGHPEATIPAIQNKLFPMMMANFAVWPIAHLINFKFIPSQQRILYINCIQIAWSAYLSNLSAARVQKIT